MELGLDAVDDRNIFNALSRSARSTTCCCIAFESLNQMILPKQSLHIWTWHIQTHRFSFLYNLFLDDLLATAEELHLPFLKFCLETCKLIGGLST